MGRRRRQLQVLLLERQDIGTIDDQRRCIIARTQIEAYSAVNVLVEIAGMGMQQQKTLGKEKYQQEAKCEHALEGVPG